MAIKISTPKVKLTKKVRALKSSDPTDVTGKKRHYLYKNSIDHIDKAMKHGYYLEAITLIESLISDRLESRLGKITTSNKYDIKPLVDLLNGIREKETNGVIKKLCMVDTGDLFIWKNDRNNALHTMAKLAQDDSDPYWQARKEECKEIAERGFRLFKALKNIINNITADSKKKLKT